MHKKKYNYYKPVKKRYGEYSNVLLHDNEYEELIDDKLEFLNTLSYMIKKGTKVKTDHYTAIIYLYKKEKQRLEKRKILKAMV